MKLICFAVPYFIVVNWGMMRSGQIHVSNANRNQDHFLQPWKAPQLSAYIWLVLLSLFSSLREFTDK